MNPRARTPKLSWPKRALLSRLLAGTLPPKLASRLHQSIARDPEWLSAYDVLRQAERRAAGNVDVTEAQVALFERIVVAQAAATAPSRTAPRAALGLALAAAAAVAVFIAVPRPSEEGWATRSASPHDSKIGVRVRCLVSAPRGTRLLSESVLSPEQRPAQLSCPSDGLLAFSVTNLASAPRHVFLVGIGARNELRWYAPFEPQAGSVQVGAGEVDRVLETLAELKGLPAEERVTLFALFSDEPVDGVSLEARLKDARARGIPLSKVDRLPVGVQLQARAELRAATGAQAP